MTPIGFNLNFFFSFIFSFSLGVLHYLSTQALYSRKQVLDSTEITHRAVALRTVMDPRVSAPIITSIVVTRSPLTTVAASSTQLIIAVTVKWLTLDDTVLQEIDDLQDISKIISTNYSNACVHNVYAKTKAIFIKWSCLFRHSIHFSMSYAYVYHKHIKTSLFNQKILINAFFEILIMILNKTQKIFT